MLPSNAGTFIGLSSLRISKVDCTIGMLLVVVRKRGIISSSVAILSSLHSSFPTCGLNPPDTQKERELHISGSGNAFEFHTVERQLILSPTSRPPTTQKKHQEESCTENVLQQEQQQHSQLSKKGRRVANSTSKLRSVSSSPGHQTEEKAFCLLCPWYRGRERARKKKRQKINFPTFFTFLSRSVCCDQLSRCTYIDSFHANKG